MFKNIGEGARVRSLHHCTIGEEKRPLFPLLGNAKGERGEKQAIGMLLFLF